MRIVLFDIDGTLIATGGAGLVALRRVFRDQHGVEDAVEGSEFHGRTDPLIFDSIARRHLGREMSPEESTRAQRGYLDRLPGCLQETAYRELDGVRELVADLHERTDTLLGLATGNLEEAAQVKLARGELSDFFKGRLDNLFITGRPLDREEIAALARASGAR